ncbi:MAG: formylglycine-generating enzyme family protein [Chloroflexia bacterium]|nr:formylglycine-generating enzyme family protein [Chloroflexia bacterium]
MKKPALLLGLALLLALTGCRLADPPARAILGDTWTRPEDDMVTVYVPAGEFTMGSTDAQIEAALELCRSSRETCERSTFEDELPAHPVALSAFWLDQTEVSNAQYRRCVEEEGCTPPACWEDGALNGGDLPVVCVTWAQAQAYCEWVDGRLPSEAEWEYAARGAEGRMFSWGDSFEGSRLNYCDRNCGFDVRDEDVDDGYAQAAPVGSFPQGASWCGALDLAGNVWEWVGDWYGDYPAERQQDPQGPSGSRRVLRGGSWDIDPAFVRGAARNWGLADSHSQVTGFRCVWSLAPDIEP